MLATVSSPWEVRKLLAKGRKLVDFEFSVFLSRALNQEEIQVDQSMLPKKRARPNTCGASFETKHPY